MFGNPETTTGGRALKFYSSVRVEVRRMAAIKDGEKIVGNRTKVKIVKNKVAAPFREAEVDILYGQGISRDGDLLDLGVTQELVEKSGSWFSYGGQRIGQGRDNARTFLSQNPALADRLDTELRARLSLPNAPGLASLPAAGHSPDLAQNGPRGSKSPFHRLPGCARLRKPRKSAGLEHSSLYKRLGKSYDLVETIRYGYVLASRDRTRKNHTRRGKWQQLS